MRLIDADEILGCGFSEWLACVLCGRATKEHPSCDGACDIQARLYADRAADALVSWLADVPTIEAEPVRHGHWVNDNDPFYPYSSHCSVCEESALTKEGTMHDYVLSEHCPNCGAKMDAT